MVEIDLNDLIALAGVEHYPAWDEFQFIPTAQGATGPVGSGVRAWGVLAFQSVPEGIELGQNGETEKNRSDGNSRTKVGTKASTHKTDKCWETRSDEKTAKRRLKLFVKPKSPVISCL